MEDDNCSDSDEEDCIEKVKEKIPPIQSEIEL